MNQKELSGWLKALVIISGLMGLVLCFVFAPLVGNEIMIIEPSLAHMFWPCLIFIWLACIPVYIALFEAWKIFDNIGIDNAFSEENVESLKKIYRLSITEIIIYFGAAIFLLTQKLVNIQIFIVIFVILFACMFVAMASATLSHLVKKALALKKENDLTI